MHCVYHNLIKIIRISKKIYWNFRFDCLVYEEIKDARYIKKVFKTIAEKNRE